MEPGSAPLHTSTKKERGKRRIDQRFAVFDVRTIHISHCSSKPDNAAYQVEGSVYREVRQWFEKWSDSAFPDMFGVSDDKTAGNDENPIRLGCTTTEFENILEAMYPGDHSTPIELDKDEWIGVLKLARLWNMPELVSIAVDQISPDLSPMEKITMGKASAHHVAQWIREGYTEIIGDLNKMTLEGLAAELGWETTARVLWALKKASFKFQPSLSDLTTSLVVDEIAEEELGGEDVADIVADLHSTYLDAIPSSLRITVTQENPVPRRAGTASIITFAPDGVYVSRTYDQAPTRVLQDFGYDAGWRVEKHVRLVGDTTGCGNSDIIAFGEEGVHVSRNNGDGTFAPSKLVLNDFGYSNGWRVDNHLRYVVDLRRKGFVDIIGFGDEGVYVALNKGNGTFSSPTIVLQDFGYNTGGWRLERHLRFLADVTGNGLPDIIGFGEAAVHVALNNGDGRFEQSEIAIQDFTPASGGWLVDRHPRTIADVTGDGRVDIIGFSDDGVHVALNAGNGTFHPAKLVVEAFGYSKGWRVESHPRFVADITGNGRGDIVGCGDICTSAALNNGDGTFGLLSILFQDYTRRYLRLLVDLTGNGAADMIRFGEDGIWVAINDGKGTFGPVQKLREASSDGIGKNVHWVTNLYA